MHCAQSVNIWSVNLNLVHHYFVGMPFREYKEFILAINCHGFFLFPIDVTSGYTWHVTCVRAKRRLGFDLRSNKSGQNLAVRMETHLGRLAIP